MRDGLQQAPGSQPVPWKGDGASTQAATEGIISVFIYLRQESVLLCCRYVPRLNGVIWLQVGQTSCRRRQSRQHLAPASNS